jgi:RNA 3'-terminal phosphate cyclase (ATP)
MKTLDGSEGEGGGQVLRTALSLSVITGEPFEMVRIRARRSKPGLLKQHLTSVRAAKAISSAEVEGDHLESQHLRFTPKRLTPGEHRFAVGSAGSAMLVLQSVLPALLMADAPSTLTLEGGTHNPASPPFDFLERTFLPQLAKMGAQVQAELVRPGFYPKGGGVMKVQIVPPSRWNRLELMDRGPLLRRRAAARLAGLPYSIAERQLRVLSTALGWRQDEMAVEELDPRFGPGNVVVADLDFGEVCEVCTGFGERGLRAETVAERLAGDVLRFVEHNAPVGEHLADQLLLPMALAGEGAFVTGPVSSHTATQIESLRQFLTVDVELKERSEERVEVRIRRP